MNHLRKNLSRFRLITFDVTDTLLEYATPPECYYAQVINGVLKPNIGLSIDQKAIANSFGSCFRVLKTQHPNFGCSTPARHIDQRVDNWRWWWRTLVERVILDAAKRNANEIPSGLLLKIADQLIEDYTCDSAGVCWKKRAGVDDFLQQLQATGRSIGTGPYTLPILGVVSNFDPRLETILRRHQLLKQSDTRDVDGVDFVVSSYEIGTEKPDPIIFQTALRRASALADSVIHPHEALHIGNLCLEDYHGARGAGWHALLVNVSSKARTSEKCRNIQGHHIFKGIPELQSCLSSDRTFPW
ncbi:rhythmically expressed gene 2 protein-like isoform X4 [Anopheles albimanus]|uniref:Haloacid dehalogenase-like hydrolase domain-containing protein 3 n=1 Tax=Anopheles albimanus TaxID=7167 RepID=A0A1I8JSR7_ANOAL|nr:rhythmically expressed gene 2 protein-like isoform X4 [Anopheles albimanus]